MLGKRLRTTVGRFVGDVQEDAVVAAGLHLVVDGAGHDVARRQILQLVIFLHEGGAVAAAQDGAFAAHRFGDQERFGLADGTGWWGGTA